MFSCRKFTFILAFLCLGMVFFVIPEIAKAAAITSISPTVVIPGETVMTIKGTGFGIRDAYVCFDGSYVHQCVYLFEELSWTDTVIMVNVPKGIIDGNVSVYYYTDDSTYSTKEIKGPAYTILKPIIDSVFPDILPYDGLITITGRNFGSQEGYINSYLYSHTTGIESWTDTEITFRVTDSNVCSWIVVETKWGAKSEEYNFEYISPSIDSISSNTIKVGDQVTITGKNFFEPGGIYFNNTECYSWNQTQTIIRWSNTKIIFQVKCGCAR